MAHLDYSNGFEKGRFSALIAHGARLTSDWLKARSARREELQRLWENRQAFRALLHKEDWVYHDMGIHRADVEFLANQPLHVNAALELQKLKDQNRRK